MVLSVWYIQTTRAMEGLGLPFPLCLLFEVTCNHVRLHGVALALTNQRPAPRRFHSFSQAQFQLANPVPVELRLALSLIMTTHPPMKVEMQLEIDHIWSVGR